MRIAGRFAGAVAVVLLGIAAAFGAGEWHVPYSPPCMEREDVFSFTRTPTVRLVKKDSYEIAFAVKGKCDATVGIVDAGGNVVRHLASGVLGPNAPEPFQKNSLEQKIHWNGKDDFGRYVKEPTKLSVRVSLGLKPVFDKVLGRHTHDFANEYRAVIADRTGVYVMGAQHVQLRRYDRDGKYVKTVFPPDPAIPLEKFAGMHSLEVEPGRRVLHSSVTDSLKVGSVSGYGHYLPGGFAVNPHQPCIAAGRLFYVRSGEYNAPGLLYGMRVPDGTAVDGGFLWIKMARGQGRRGGNEFGNSRPKLAASPDGKWLYLSGLSYHSTGVHGVHRLDASKREPLPPRAFLGEDYKPGSDNAHFNGPQGIACDAKGRVYICDSANNRIQAFSSEGTFRKTLPVKRPHLVHIDRNTGAIYVAHKATVKGRSVWMLAKLRSIDDPKSVFAHPIGCHPEGQPLFALDCWGDRPRVWLTDGTSGLVVLEEREGALVKIRGFSDEVTQAGLAVGMMKAKPRKHWKVSADPTREQVYYYNDDRSFSRRYDLKTGACEKIWLPGGGFGPERTFDRKGYLHCHDIGSVYRYDPGRPYEYKAHGWKPHKRMTVVPYDYGTHGDDTNGITLKDQKGAKFFQDGIGVSMRGDLAVVSNIYFVPKFQDTAITSVVRNRGMDDGRDFYTHLAEGYMKALKNGQTIYTMKRWPGRMLAGATIWVFDHTGELRTEDAIPGLSLVNGVQLDEDGGLYTVFNSRRMVAGKPFLAGRGRVIGQKDGKALSPFTGTMLKAPPSGCRILSKGAPIAMDPWPARPHDVQGSMTEGAIGLDAPSWVENCRWLYAGASPIVPGGCSCPYLRHHTDWYKRSFVPEAYRHSFGVLDANGNLLMHLGRYGNADCESVSFSYAPCITGTDNYLCVSDVGNERLVVMRLDYHTRETAQVK